MKHFVTPKISKMLNSCLCSITKAAQQNLALLLAMSLLTAVFSVNGQNVDLNQVRNGSASSPDDPAPWVNGNAGPSNAHYSEGYSIPYRMYITGLSIGSHELIIEWDTKEGNGHAIDYITHYNNMDNPAGSHVATFGHGPEMIDPTMGITGLGASSTFPIPAPSSVGAEVAGQPTASFNALAAGLRLMTIWNGTITAMSYVNQDPPDGTTSSTKSSIKITFTANNSSVLLSWGGHIAAEYNWGVGRGATGVSGSPYHTRLVSLDGKGGNQDRSLKASAVVIPPPVCSISTAQLACPETPFLTFSSAGSTTGIGITYAWELTNGTPSAGAKIDPATVNSADVKVIPIGSSFIAGGTFSLKLTVTRSTGQSSTCERSPAGTIVKVVVAAKASPTIIDIAIGNTSQLDVDLTGSGDTDPTHYTYSWTQNPAAGGSLSANNIRNPVFTATLPGFYEFEVTATQIAAPKCSSKGKVTVEVVAGAPPCGVSGPSPICPATTNSYVYDPDNDGAADPIPLNFTAQWTLEGNTNGAGINGSSTDKTVSVVSTSTCNSAYTIKITLTSTSGLIVRSCSTTVTVDDDVKPVITCPEDKDLQCNESTEPANTGSATATDNCTANPTITYTDAPVAPNCTGKAGIDRTWKATDGCGNFSTCVQKIRFVDNTKPTITCPQNVDLECGASTNPSNTGTATGTDNCGTPNISYTDQEVPANCTGQKGIDRTWKATDGCGNFVTCVQQIRFVDNTPPVITNCPADKVIECSASLDPANTGMPTGTDNCTKATFTYKDESTSNNCQTIITRTWVAKDDCGNESAPCVQHIITRDRTAPVINCAAPGDPVITDNCTLTPNISVFYRDNGATRTWTAVDESGNIATCDQPIAPPVAPAQKENVVQQSGATNPTATTTIENSRKIPEVEKVDDLAVTAYPNPFNREVNFRFVSPRSGKAVLEVFDLVGRRIGVVYQGEVQANEQKNVTYRVAATNSSPLIYKLSVDGLHAHGKLMSSKK